MKIIFLDIDGVINNRASMRKHTESGSIYNLDGDCVGRLNRICMLTGAYCVLSSTWRHGWPVAALLKFMRKEGFLGYIVDRTPNLPLKDRGAEIAVYLNQCRERGYPVDSFVILDDDSDMGTLKPYLVQTTTALGLEEKHVAEAVNMIENGPAEGRNDHG